MKINAHWFLLVLIAVFFTSCGEDEEPIVADYSQSIWLLNEGNFNWGNASLSMVDPEGNITHEAFSLVNNIPLGDVAQSMVQIDSTMYIVVNNSGLIYKVSRRTGKVSGQINGLTSPRYLLGFPDGKGYVTDLSSSQIAIVDWQNDAVTGEIYTGGWTEAIQQISNGEVWVTKMGGDKILVLDATTDQITDSIQVGREPNSLVEDAEGNVWVLCSGGLQETAPSLYQIRSSDHQVQAQWTFPDDTQSPGQLSIDPSGTQVYFLNGDLFQMGTHENALPTEAFIRSEGRTFYGLQTNSQGQVIVTDAKDFVQSGEVLVYDAEGNLLQTYAGRAIPNALAFPKN